MQNNGIVIKNPWPMDGTVPVVTTDGRPVPVESLVAAALEFAQQHRRNVLISEGGVMLPVSPQEDVASLVAAFEAARAKNPEVPNSDHCETVPASAAPDYMNATRLVCGR